MNGYVFINATAPTPFPGTSPRHSPLLSSLLSREPLPAVLSLPFSLIFQGKPRRFFCFTRQLLPRFSPLRNRLGCYLIRMKLRREEVDGFAVITRSF